jgi:hypothetical protein
MLTQSGLIFDATRIYQPLKPIVHRPLKQNILQLRVGNKSAHGRPGYPTEQRYPPHTPLNIHSSPFVPATQC